jgi:hypothetical protein
VDKFDIARSLLRSAAVSARDQIKRLQFPRTVRQAVQDTIRRQVRLQDKQLTATVGRVAGISAITIAASDGRLLIDANLTDGKELIASLIPAGIVCAPGGAKDVSFQVEPASAADNGTLADIAGAIASEIARVVWGPLLFQKNKSMHSAFVERDGDILRVDLRTVPEVRAAMGQRATAMMIEALVVKDIVAEQGALRLTVGIQGMP